MGLFDVFKKKAPSHSEKVALAYKCYKAEMVGMVFPGGQTQASNIIISMAKIFGLKLEECDAKKYYDVLSTYSDVLIRRVVTQSSDEHILTSLQVKHADLVKSKEIAQKALAFVTLNMMNNDFMLNTTEDLSVLDLVSGTLAEMGQTADNNTEAEQGNLGDSEYGLVANKPIYTKGVSGSQHYIESLKAASGEKLTWNRRGSMSVQGINGMIDVYDSTLPSGKPYKTLYVNMYGSKNSDIVPKGFSK